MRSRARTGGLCWPHFVGTRDLCRAGRAALEEAQSGHLAALAGDVEALIASFDYQFHGERPPRVEAAWRRVVAAMAGRFQGGRKSEPDAVSRNKEGGH